MARFFCWLRSCSVRRTPWHNVRLRPCGARSPTRPGDRGRRQVVTLNEATGFTRTTVTNNDGLYTFADLPVGTYRVEVEHAGFKAEVRSKMRLNVADTRAVDVQLATGDVAEVVNVEPSARAVQTVGRRGVRPRHRRAGARAAPERPQLHAARHPHARRQRARRPERQGQGAARRLGPLGQRRRPSPRTCGRWTAPTTTTSAPTAPSSSTRRVDAIEEFKIHRNSYGAEFGQARRARRSTSSPAAARTSSTAARSTSAGATP